MWINHFHITLYGKTSFFIISPTRLEHMLDKSLCIHNLFVTHTKNQAYRHFTSWHMLSPLAVETTTKNLENCRPIYAAISERKYIMHVEVVLYPGWDQISMDLHQCEHEQRACSLPSNDLATYNRATNAASSKFNAIKQKYALAIDAFHPFSSPCKWRSTIILQLLTSFSFVASSLRSAQQKPFCLTKCFRRCENERKNERAEKKAACWSVYTERATHPF